MSLPAEPLFYLVASIAIALIGMAKGGFVGLGGASMPMLALVMDPVQAVAMMLPIVMLQDVVGVWSFRKSYDVQTLAWMMPGACVGVFFGWLLAANVDGNAIRGLVGLISLVFGFYRLIGFKPKASRPLPQWLASFWGMVSGFAGQVALSGGPPFQVWALSRNLPHTVFIGTSAIFFAFANVIKVPAFFALGQFTRQTLMLTLVFVPVALASTMAGVWLVRRLDPDRFYRIINLLMVAVGLGLLAQSML